MTFRVQAGRGNNVLVTGPNGSGKSSLFRYVSRVGGWVAGWRGGGWIWKKSKGWAEGIPFVFFFVAAGGGSIRGEHRNNRWGNPTNGVGHRSSAYLTWAGESRKNTSNLPHLLKIHDHRMLCGLWPVTAGTLSKPPRGQVRACIACVHAMGGTGEKTKEERRSSQL